MTQPPDYLMNSEWHVLTKSLHLSGREAEILAGLMRGQTEASMVADLKLSRGTVHTYVQRVYGKLGGAKSRPQAIACMFAAYASSQRTRPVEGVLTSASDHG